MQDRFKFRMYDANVNKMYMPNDFKEVESIYECIKQQINWDLDVDYDIKFNHLEDGRFFMQCTGLKDKNGTLIYEGDIVNYSCLPGYSDIYACTFNNGSFLIGGLLISNTHLKSEVIGNIYESPELLEV